MQGRVVGKSNAFANIELTIKGTPTKEQISYIFDIMQESLYENLCFDEEPDIEELDSREPFEGDFEDEIKFEMAYNIQVTVHGQGWYEPARLDGPPEKCYPSSSDAEFSLPEVTYTSINDYLKGYFEKQEKLKNLFLIDVVSYVDELEEPEEWEFDYSYDDW